MTDRNNTTSNNGSGDTTRAEQEWPGIDSRYRLIIVAALRAKQLQRGAHPRIEVDPRRHRNTSIAVEETKQGLVPFTNKVPTGGANGHGNQGNL